MRVRVAQKAVRAGSKLRIACTARGCAAVSIWGAVGDAGVFPYIPHVPDLAEGKPQIVAPLFKRFEGHYEFIVQPADDMTVIVMLEVDTAADIKNTGLKVRLIHGRFGETALQIRRALGDAFRAVRRSHAGCFGNQR